MTESAKALPCVLLPESDGKPMPFDEVDGIDPNVSCSHCAALCCRLTVVLVPQDADVPPQFTTRTAEGHRVMAQGADGFCLALGPDRRSCSIYARRPQACRRFAMGGGYCRAVREDFARAIEIRVRPPPT